jgi:hypothetical protein
MGSEGALETPPHYPMAAHPWQRQRIARRPTRSATVIPKQVRSLSLGSRSGSPVGAPWGGPGADARASGSVGPRGSTPRCPSLRFLVQDPVSLSSGITVPAHVIWPPLRLTDVHSKVPRPDCEWVPIPSTDPQRVGRRRQRQRHTATAHGTGIRHRHTAPAYGTGIRHRHTAVLAARRASSRSTPARTGPNGEIGPAPRSRAVSAGGERP